MKFDKNKLLTTVTAVALVLAVGACSSSGDDAGITAERDDALAALKLAETARDAALADLAKAQGVQTDADLAAEELTAAQQQLKTAQEAVDTAEANLAIANAMQGDLTETPDAGLTAARLELKTAQVAEATAMANLKTANEKLMAANEKLMAANGRLVSALQDLDLEPASDTMSVEDQIAENTATLKNKLAEDKKDEDLATRIARASMVLMSIGEDPGGIVRKPFPPTGASVTGVTAERDADDLVTVDLNGELDDDYADNEITAGSGDWNSVTMTKTNADDTTDTVVVYTDIAAPTDADFGTLYPSGTNFLDADNVEEAQADNFPMGPSQQLTYSATSGNPLSFRGTFDDVPGVFVCSEDTECILSTDPKGVLEASEHTWGFTPDAPNSATVKKPAEAYTYFGWWLNKPVKAAGMHAVDVFAGGVMDHDAEITQAIVGTAKYAGPAAGKYATETFTAGVQTDAAVGHFTATANLTAKFGTVSEMGDGISGTVTGFELDDVTSVPWKVILEPTGEFQPNNANFTGTTEVDFGGGATATENDGAGNWQGTFYGVGAEAADAPTTVVGTFGAAHQDASVLGAFGATKQ